MVVYYYCILCWCFGLIVLTITVCPRSSDPFYIVTYYIKWGPTSWRDVSCTSKLNLFVWFFFCVVTHRKRNVGQWGNLHTFVSPSLSKYTVWPKKSVYFVSTIKYSRNIKCAFRVHWRKHVLSAWGIICFESLLANLNVQGRSDNILVLLIDWLYGRIKICDWIGGFNSTPST